MATITPADEECGCCTATATHEVPGLAFDGMRRRYPALACPFHAADWASGGHRVITLAQRAVELAA